MLPYYYSLNEYLKKTYGRKIYKLALDGRMTCPNRDGTLDTRGCIFCSHGGSGDFTGRSLLLKDIKESSVNPDISFCSNIHEDLIKHDIDIQIKRAKENISSKYSGESFIAYFQSYTNTYADISYLQTLYTAAVSRDDVCILSIATRPDCLDDNIIALLSKINQIKPVWIELGLQTIHEKTAQYIRRGYKTSVFDIAVEKLHKAGIKVIVHQIIGLPGETDDMIKETAMHIADCNVFGIKLQLLHILKGTDLAKDYENQLFSEMSLEHYCHCLGNILEILPKDMVIHRITGDGPKNLLIAPLWSSDKKRVMNTINKYLQENNIMQGRNYNEYRSNNAL